MIEILKLQIMEEGECYGVNEITSWREFGLKISQSMARHVDDDFSFTWNYFAEFFEEKVRHGVKREFLIYYDENGTRMAISYQKFCDLVNRTARYLKENLNIKRGDRVATFLPNHFEAAVIFFAVWRLGACLVPIDIEESLAHKYCVVKETHSKVVFCSQQFIEEIRDFLVRLSDWPELIQVGGEQFASIHHWPQVIGKGSTEPLESVLGLDDESLITCTSGASGQPKCVVLTFRNLLAGADGIVDWFGFSAGDCLMSVLPFHNVNGLMLALFAPFYANCKVVLNGVAGSGNFWGRVDEEKVAFASVVPQYLVTLLSKDEKKIEYDLRRLRGIICGAGTLTAEIALNFERRFGFPVITGYGLSEATGCSCFLPPDLEPAERHRLLSGFDFPSVGVPVKHNEMTVISPEGRELGEMEQGEIVIRGRTVMKEYLKSFEDNLNSFRYGWFLSGDKGFYKIDSIGRKFFFVSGKLNN